MNIVNGTYEEQTFEVKLKIKIIFRVLYAEFFHVKIIEIFKLTNIYWPLTGK